MYTNENFTADVVRSFQFLETEYGMRRDPTHVEGGGSWIVYGNANVKVVIERDSGGYCGVSLVNLHHVKRDPQERSEFDLDEVVAVSGARPPRRQEPRSMTEAVTRAAETLRSAGGPVLKGDFESLHARHRQVLEAARRNSPLAPNGN
jgi:hypothetical protein